MHHDPAWLVALSTPVTDLLPEEGPRGPSILVSIAIGFVVSIIVFVPSYPRLKSSHDRIERVRDEADSPTRRRIDFYRPPSFLRRGIAGMLLQFLLFLLPITILVHYLRGRL